MTTPASQPPSLWRWSNELVAVPKVIANTLRKPVDHTAFGKDRPVFVIPGMLSGDRSTVLLRRSLDAAGFRSIGWGQRFNTGATNATIDRVGERLKELVEREGRPAILIGWSLGGLYARLLALRFPQYAAAVVTMGSPISGDRRANNAWRLYEALNDHSVDDPPFPEELSTKPACPTIAIWSHRDGIVAPASARGTENERDRAFELPYRHFEFGVSRGAIRALFDILEQALG